MNFPFLSARPEETSRVALVIPTQESCDREDQWHINAPVLKKAAQQIIDSKLIYRWNRYSGRQVLVRWSAEDHIFVTFSIDDWCLWLGQHWMIKDTMGFEWLGPSHAVADRLWQTVLKHPDLPLASYQLQDERRRAGK